MGLFDKFKKKSDDVTAAASQLTEPASPETEEKVSGGIFAKFTRGLKKTKQLLKTDIRDLFRKEGRSGR